MAGKPDKRSLEGFSSDPRMPIPYEVATVYAIKAVYAGTATEHQQRVFVAWLERACAVNDMEFRTGVDGDRLTAFAGGKRSVGLQIRKLATMSPAVLADLQELESAKQVKNG